MRKGVKKLKEMSPLIGDEVPVKFYYKKSNSVVTVDTYAVTPDGKFRNRIYSPGDLIGRADGKNYFRRAIRISYKNDSLLLSVGLVMLYSFNVPNPNNYQSFVYLDDTTDDRLDNIKWASRTEVVEWINKHQEQLQVPTIYAKRPNKRYTHSDEEVNMVLSLKAKNPNYTASDIVDIINQKFNTSIHKRTVYRYLLGYSRKNI